MLDPLRQIDRLDRRLDRLMRELWSGEADFPRLTGASESLALPSGVRMPAIDLKENDKEYTVVAEVPGVKKEDINIDIHDNLLEIKAQTSEEKKEEKEGYVYKERREGSFYRSLELPSNVNMDKSKASYKNGVLTLTLPKVESLPKKKIAIE